MSSSPNEKKSSSVFPKNTNFILSEINTDKTFKNVLRGGDGDVIYIYMFHFNSMCIRSIG